MNSKAVWFIVDRKTTHCIGLWNEDKDMKKEEIDFIFLDSYIDSINEEALAYDIHHIAANYVHYRSSSSTDFLSLRIYPTRSLPTCFDSFIFRYTTTIYTITIWLCLYTIIVSSRNPNPSINLRSLSLYWHIHIPCFIANLEQIKTKRESETNEFTASTLWLGHQDSQKRFAHTSTSRKGPHYYDLESWQPMHLYRSGR